MAEEVVFHRREFTEDIQKLIKAECDANKYIWRGFENVLFVKRELDMGLKFAEKLIPEPLHRHIQSKVDPFDYNIEFYLSIGYEE